MFLQRSVSRSASSMGSSASRVGSGASPVPSSALAGASSASHNARHNASSHDRRPEPGNDTDKGRFQFRTGTAASLAENPRRR